MKKTTSSDLVQKNVCGYGRKAPWAPSNQCHHQLLWACMCAHWLRTCVDAAEGSDKGCGRGGFRVALQSG